MFRNDWNHDGKTDWVDFTMDEEIRNDTTWNGGRRRLSEQEPLILVIAVFLFLLIGGLIASACDRMKPDCAYSGCSLDTVKSSDYCSKHKEKAEFEEGFEAFIRQNYGDAYYENLYE